MSQNTPVSEKIVSNKIKIYMGVPSTGNRSDAQCYALRALEKNYGDRIEFVYPELCVQRIFHDYARNAYVEQFLASNCDILWFLDSDVVPNPKVLDLVTEHLDKWELAGAPYPVFITQNGSEGPQVVFTVYKKDSKGFHPTAIPREGQDFVDGVATGCIFIKRSVFSKLTKPYFEFKYANESRELIEGEDLGFCRKTHALGLKFFIDYSMVCKHYKTVDLLDVNNYAITYSNANYQVFEKQINEIVTKYRMAKMQRATQQVYPTQAGLVGAPTNALLKR